MLARGMNQLPMTSHMNYINILSTAGERKEIASEAVSKVRIKINASRSCEIADPQILRAWEQQIRRRDGGV